MGIFSKSKKDEPAKDTASKESASDPSVGVAPGTVDPKTGVLAGGTAKPKSSDKKRALKKDTGIAYRILQYPIISEKASNLAVDSKYTFRVSRDSTKKQISAAVLSVYDVKPSKVNFMNISGKARRQGHTTGSKADWKKAIVTLSEGKTIDVNES